MVRVITNRPSPAMTSSQNRLDSLSRVVSRRWMMALEMPMSLNACTTPITTMAMAMRPKS